MAAQSAPTPSGPPRGSGSDVRLTVSGVAARLGVAAPTLRTWARRYGLGPSGHIAGSHRRYSTADLARLENMRRLTLQGVAPADAARIVLDDGGVAEVPTSGGPESRSNGREAGGDGSDRASANGTARDADADADAAPASTASVGSANGRLEYPGLDPVTDSASHGEAMMVADPLTVAAAAVDGDTHRLDRLIRRADQEHGLLEGWLMAVRPAAEMVAQRPMPDRPGQDPELLLHSRMLHSLTRPRAAREPAAGNALIHYAPQMHTDAHVLAAELTSRGVDARVAHAKLEANQAQPMLDLVARQPGTLTVILGESEVAEDLVSALCERGDEVFLVALTDAIEPRPGLHRARTLSGALHEVMGLLSDRHEV